MVLAEWIGYILKLKGGWCFCNIEMIYFLTHVILMHRLKIQGFIILDYMDRYPEATADLVKWMDEGKLKVRLDVSDGLETALQTVKKLYTGENTGKLMVRVKDV